MGSSRTICVNPVVVNDAPTAGCGYINVNSGVINAPPYSLMWVFIRESGRHK